METLSYCQLMERCLAAEARVVELTAENVTLKAGVAEEIEVINRGGQRYCVKDGMSINPIYARGWNDHRANVTAVQTPATDRIVAGIKADAIEEVLKIMGGFSSDECGDSVYFDVQDFAKQLREDAK